MQESPLTSATQRALEHSLAMQMLRLFACVASGSGEGARKRAFVHDFYANLYPEDITNHFCQRYETELQAPPVVPNLAEDLNTRLSYQEKVFSIMAVYEFLLFDGVDESELETARSLARALAVTSEDLAYIEDIFNVRAASPEELEASAILTLRITGDVNNADVWLPYPGLDMVVHRIHNLFCVTTRNDLHRVVVEGNTLKKDFTARITQHFHIRVNDYTLRYQDLIVYFRNKVNRLQTSLYVKQKDLELAFAVEPNSNSLLRLDVRESQIMLEPLDPDAVIAHNRRRVRSGVRMNLNDEVYVNGFRLDLREAFYYISSRGEVDIDEERSHYVISNDIKADIFIHDALPERWRAFIRVEEAGLVLEKGSCPYQIYCNGRVAPSGRELGHGDIIFLHDNFIELDAKAGVFRRSVFSFRKLVAEGLRYTFDDGTPGLDDVTFDVEYGELVCIMGPSGSGKSTLLSCISGLLRPQGGRVLVDHYNLHQEYEQLKDYFGYVPQDDLLLPNLTVWENLYYHARLRFPEKTDEELGARIDLVLDKIRLQEKRFTRVGQPTQKTLSGGERKRLNIGLELLSDAEIFFLDEPTSGLSSKDSEKILELLSSLTLNGKIVVAVIHQPGSKLYKMFNKVILLDNGGRMAYYGTSYSALEYFKRHMEATLAGDPVEVECPHCKTVQPNVLLDSLEDSLQDIDGAVLGERKYSPEYWKAQYRRKVVSSWFSNVKLPTRDSLPPQRVITPRERFNQFLTLLRRNFTNKMRDRANLLITFLEAPLLGAGVGFILKYTPHGDYTLYTNDLFRTFLFVAVIVSLFLGMTNSVDEIIGDTALFLRERMLNITHRSYLAAKMVVLVLFAVLQNVLFIGLGFLIIEVRELWLQYLLFLSLLSYTGISIGMFISAVPRLTSKAALNVVPLVLIPQIILGGALIEYEKMNVNLTFFENSPIPEICQVMPSRWAYEALIVLQESENSYDSTHELLLDQLKAFKYARESYIELYGKKAFEERERKLSEELEDFRKEYKYAYGNKNVHDAVSVGENRLKQYLERSLPEDIDVELALPRTDWDYAYPMFVRNKVFFFSDKEVSTVYYNAMILVLMSVIFNLLTLAMLKNRDRIIAQFSSLWRGFMRNGRRGPRRG